MRKVQFALLVLTATLLFFGCQKKEGSAVADASAGTASAEYHIGVVTGTVSQSEDDRRGAEAFQEKYGEDVVKAAYEITVNNTGKASLSYANTILKNWHEDGVKKAGDIAKKSTSKTAVPKTTRQGTATARSFNVDDALTKALERSYKGGDK